MPKDVYFSSTKNKNKSIFIKKKKEAKQKNAILTKLLSFIKKKKK